MRRKVYGKKKECFLCEEIFFWEGKGGWDLVKFNVEKSNCFPNGRSGILR